jgi:hypothetical protein
MKTDTNVTTLYKVIRADTGEAIHHTCQFLTRNAANDARQNRQGRGVYAGLLLAVVEQSRAVVPFPVRVWQFERR